MTEELNTAIEQLCVLAKDFIEPLPQLDPKFIRNNGRLEFDNSPIPSVNMEIRKLPLYIELHGFISDDEVLRWGKKKVGDWGSPDTIIEEMLVRSTSIKEGKIEINKDYAKSYLENFQKVLAQKHLKFTIYRRLLGIEIVPEKIELDPQTVLIKLDEKELNERMPCLSMLEIGMPYLDLTQHTTELRCTESKKVKGYRLEYLNPTKEIKESLLEKCNIIFASLILTKGGMLELGPHSFELDFPDGMRLFENFNLSNQFMLPVYPSKIMIEEDDIDNLKSSYEAAKRICSEAGVLNSAMKRFIMGCKRVDGVDKLVDYVVSWEALLLTVDGKPVKGELSYRFGLNGSSLLHWIPDGLSREDGFAFMRVLYECRSTIVHGGGNIKNLDKSMAKIGVENVDDIANKAGEYLRRAILWLATIDEEKRPYKEKLGWEKMLWFTPSREENCSR